MKTSLSLALALVFALGQAYADEKKAHKEKEKPAAKSGKNAAQKAESSLTDWADKHNIWKRQHKKAEKK